MSLTKNGQDNHTRYDNEKKLKKNRVGLRKGLESWPSDFRFDGLTERTKPHTNSNVVAIYMVTGFNALLRHFGFGRRETGSGREKEREKEKERKRQSIFEFLTDECFSDHNERIRSIQIDKNFITQIGQFRSTRHIARHQANTSKKLLKMAIRTKFHETSMHKERSSSLRKEITSEAVLQLVEHAVDLTKHEKKKKLIEKFTGLREKERAAKHSEEVSKMQSDQDRVSIIGEIQVSQTAIKALAKARAKIWPGHEHS